MQYLHQHIITLFCILLSCGCGLSRQAADNTSLPDDKIQTDSFATPYFELKVKAQFITSDKLQQCYVVTPTNELIKYNAEGKVLFRYNNNRLGDLAWVDTTDPFNLLLFYPEYLTLITLDRTLGSTGEFQLYDMDIAEVTAVAMSNDNNIWLFDQTSARILKLTRQGDILIESANLNLLFESRLAPDFMLEHNNLLYVNVPERGILVFDNFATYLKTIPIKNLSRFQIVDNKLIYDEAGKIYTFHLKSLLTDALQLPCPYESSDQLRIEKNLLFLLREGQLLYYRI